MREGLTTADTASAAKVTRGVALTNSGAPVMTGRIRGLEALWILAGGHEPPEFGDRDKSAPRGAEELCVATRCT